MDQKFKILIADDEALWVNLIKGILEKNGYQVYITTNAFEVEEIATSQNVDLVLLDVNFPEANGLTICNSIKINPNTEHIAVIMLTAQGDPSDLKKGFEAGASDYIEKHASSLELLTRIKALLKTKAKTDSVFTHKKLFENSPYPMMVLKGGVINNINKKFIETLKYDNIEELINSNINPLIDEEELGKFCKQLEEVRVKKSRESFPYKFNCKDGNYINMVVHMVYLADDEMALYCNTFA
jgi:PAS domain S-box-containing protein